MLNWYKAFIAYEDGRITKDWFSQSAYFIEVMQYYKFYQSLDQ